jgi:hypothetical protein
MATLRLPDRLARELVARCIETTPPSTRGDKLLRMVISSISELAVESAHLRSGDEGLHAEVAVHADDAREFAALFPGASRDADSPTGAVVFRLAAYGGGHPDSTTTT